MHSLKNLINGYTDEENFDDKAKSTSIHGPYRATKLWNDAVRSFYNDMPLARHWRGLRVYENCFTASEAVSWLHSYLISNPNFSSSVTRKQAAILMSKFLKCGLIVNARGTNSLADDFEDNKELFRFNSQSPLKALRTPCRAPLAPINNNNALNCGSSPSLRKAHQNTHIKQKEEWLCDSVKENMSNEEIADNSVKESEIQLKRVKKVWTEAFSERLESVSEQLMVVGDGSAPLLPSSAINATWIQHNMILLKSKEISKAEGTTSDDIPSWILCAMKCLANWPNSSNSVCNIPNYPGVEVDIFKVVREFFSSMVLPLIPYELYDPIIRVYIGAEFLDVAHRTPTPKTERILQPHSPAVPPSDSTEDLLLNISVTSPQSPTPCFDEAPKCNANSKFVGSPLRCNGSNQLEKTTNYNDIENRSCSSTLSRYRTPKTHWTEDGFSSIPRSLRLNRLENYTNFKDSYLYPEDKMWNRTPRRRSATPVEVNESVSSNRVTLKSLKNKSKLSSSRCGDLTDERRNMSRLGTNSISPPEFKKLLKSEELDEFPLPPNSCFETAFTSDSPRTRIIPQKSVDSIHFRNGTSTLRPKSIAVSTLTGKYAKFSGFGLEELNAQTRVASTGLSGKMNDSSMNRSLSDGNLIESPRKNVDPSIGLSSASLNKKEGLESHFELKKYPNSSKSSLAARVRDSIKRKKVKDNLSRFCKSVRNSSYHVSSWPENKTDILQPSQDGNCDLKTYSKQMLTSSLALKSGTNYTRSYSNSGVTLPSYSPFYTSSSKCSSSHLNHLRNSSGGFVNAGLDQSKSSSNTVDSDDCYKFWGTFYQSRPLDSVSCNSSSLSTQSKSCPSSCSAPLSEASPKTTRRSQRSQSVTPDGCLSHSLSSVNNTLYHSALSGFSVGGEASSPSPTSSAFTALTRLSPSIREELDRTCTPPQLPKRKPLMMIDVKLEESRMGEDDGLTGEDMTTSSLKSSRSANELSDDCVDRVPFGAVPPFVRGGVWKHYHASPRLLTRRGKEVCIEALQLLTLVMEPKNRWKLYLLLRMMSKVSANEKLQLDDVLTNRALVVKTFLRNVLLAAKENEYDEMLSGRVVTFLMDNHAAIFTPPQQIAVVAHRKITAMETAMKTSTTTATFNNSNNLPGVSSNTSNHIPLTYCHQVSPNTFEEQKLDGSKQFLFELLDQISQNPKLSEKEKRKKLREFKTHYPDIYDLRFPPGKENEPNLHERKGKLRGLKKLASMKALTRTKSIRI